MLEDLLPHRDRILRHKHVLLPDVHWDGTRRRVKYIAGAGEGDWSRATDVGLALSAEMPGGPWSPAD